MLQQRECIKLGPERISLQQNYVHSTTRQDITATGLYPIQELRGYHSSRIISSLYDQRNIIATGLSSGSRTGENRIMFRLRPESISQVQDYIQSRTRNDIIAQDCSPSRTRQDMIDTGLYPVQDQRGYHSYKILSCPGPDMIAQLQDYIQSRTREISQLQEYIQSRTREEITATGLYPVQDQTGYQSYRIPVHDQRGYHSNKIIASPGLKRISQLQDYTQPRRPESTAEQQINIQPRTLHVHNMVLSS